MIWKREDKAAKAKRLEQHHADTALVCKWVGKEYGRVHLMHSDITTVIAKLIRRVEALEAHVDAGE